MNALEDILAEDLSVVFCGINPGLLAAQQGHHFAGRSNRFWRTLHLAGFTAEEVRPENDRSILAYRCGLTAVVARPTARADQVSAQEFVAAAAEFEQKIARYTPRHLAFLGKAAYLGLSGQKAVPWGLQTDAFAGATVWVLPNPSGRNLAFSQEQLVMTYRQLYEAAVLQAG
jgi:TDG/mug DNA glycosylase family protein